MSGYRVARTRLDMKEHEIMCSSCSPNSEEGKVLAHVH
jgi:hypothetical protein